MRKLLAILAAVGVVLTCSVASAGWTYVTPAPVVVYRPVAPWVTYYAPPVAAVPAAPSAIVTPAPVFTPAPVLTPQTVTYPDTVVYPAPAYVPARVYYRPARGVYRVVLPY